MSSCRGCLNRCVRFVGGAICFLFAVAGLIDMFTLYSFEDLHKFCAWMIYSWGYTALGMIGLRFECGGGPGSVCACLAFGTFYLFVGCCIIADYAEEEYINGWTVVSVVIGTSAWVIA